MYDQVQTAGLSFYVPLHSAGTYHYEPYVVRCTATVGCSVPVDPRSDSIPQDVARARQLVDEFKRLRPLYLGNCFPLLPISLSEDAWCGWQFDRPDLYQGFALLFRRPNSTSASAEICLQALEPAAEYALTFVDEARTVQMLGEELACLRVEIAEAPGSDLLLYERPG